MVLSHCLGLCKTMCACFMFGFFNVLLSPCVSGK